MTYHNAGAAAAAAAAASSDPAQVDVTVFIN